MLLRPEAPAHGGAAIARSDQKTYLVDYALPGELVEASPAERRRGVVFARAERILDASPHRVQAPCPHFGACGGCQLQHAAYAYQLAWKRRVVEDAWRGAGLRLPPDAAVHGMEDPWRYRIRGEFEAVPERAAFRFGFHRIRSHDLLPIRTCPIHDLRIERALEVFRAGIVRCRVDAVQNLQLTVEPNGRGLLWALRFRGGARRLPEDFVQEIAGRLPEVVLLEDSITVDFWDLVFRVRSDTFVQTNYRQMLVLYRIALEMLQAGPGDAVLDLYAGIGTISLAVARTAASVTAVEANRSAAAMARVNMRINAAENVHLLVGTVEKSLRQVRAGEHQAAILDPPRAGCEPAAIAELLRLGPDRLVYVSCEPSTHARDIAALVRGGYRVRRAAVVDMFPQTYHIESVVLLERTPGSTR